MKMGFQGLSCLTFFFFTIHLIICSQTVIFKGIIKDEETLKPIQEVNIKVYGTVSGTSSDHAGNFSLKTDKIPATIIFTCVGYETASYTIVGTPKTPIEFQLRPKSYLLGEVDISSKKYSYMFKDKDFSVLDYEILGDDLILLIFKYQLKQSGLSSLCLSTYSCRIYHPSKCLEQAVVKKFSVLNSSLACPPIVDYSGKVLTIGGPVCSSYISTITLGSSLTIGPVSGLNFDSTYGLNDNFYASCCVFVDAKTGEIIVSRSGSAQIGNGIS